MKLSASIKLVDSLPTSVKVFTHTDLEDNHYIYINECLSEEARDTVLIHEIEHITKRHFGSDETVEEKEQAVR